MIGAIFLGDRGVFLSLFVAVSFYLRTIQLKHVELFEREIIKIRYTFVAI